MIRDALILAALIIAAIAANHAAAADTAENIRQLQGTSVGSTPIRTACTTVVIDGKNYVQETWRRGNFTWTNLKAERKLVGAQIKNSTEKQLEELAEQIKARVAEYASMSNRAAVAEAARAAAETAKEKAEAARASIFSFLEQKRDEARLSTTKAIYQAIIDKMNEAAK